MNKIMKGNNIIIKLNKLVSHYRFGKSFLFRPLTGIQSIVKCLWVYSDYFGPLSYTMSFVSKCYQVVISCISGLQLSTSPPTVFFAVISIIINSIECSIFFTKFLTMKFVTLIHIIPKFLKGFPETLYSTPTVKWIVKGSSIIASGLRIGEYCIKTSPIHFVLISEYTNKLAFLVSHIFKPKLDIRFVSRYPISATKLIIATI